MHELLNMNRFLVKEHIGLIKAANNYDIYDPETGKMVMVCREDDLGTVTKLLRFTDWKRNTPFNIEIRTPDGEQLMRVKRGVAIFLSDVHVHDENEAVIGGFKQKFFSIGGAFDILDTQGNALCSLRGKWTGWDFRLIHNDIEFAHVTKKWAGIGKEFFTSADNYMLEISSRVKEDSPIRQLILAAVMCIDMVLKE
ncbi:MAG: phospholipid scramblase-related protein [Candidatus Poribacteria bacterium]|nr:phospholipid scramblase-related protein [Candidatus Poribacteria bacterium]MDE0502587.1 phospholipid scramblase-related protein [Candidatus Poribacteria bacterium]